MSNYITIEANPRFLQKTTKKIHFGGSFSSTKCYPWAWPRNLSAISPTRNVAFMYAPPLCIQPKSGKIYRFCYFLKAFLSLNLDKYFALYCERYCIGVFVLRFPIFFYWLSGLKWIRMWSHRPWLRLLTKPTPILSQSMCHGSHNFIDLSCVNIQSWA